MFSVIYGARLIFGCVGDGRPLAQWFQDFAFQCVKPRVSGGSCILLSRLLGDWIGWKTSRCYISNKESGVLSISAFWKGTLQGWTIVSILSRRDWTLLRGLVSPGYIHLE